jgi:hypothetical protein
MIRLNQKKTLIPEAASTGRWTLKHRIVRIRPLALAVAALVLTIGGRAQALLRVTPPAAGLTIEDFWTGSFSDFSLLSLGRPKAGEFFMAAVRVVRDDTLELVQVGLIDCQAQIGRRGASVPPAFVGFHESWSVCVWVIPADAHWKLRGWVSVSVSSLGLGSRRYATAEQRFAKRIRRLR